MTGRYKAPNLTARLNGLTDKQEVDMKAQVSPFTPFDIDVPEDNSTGQDSSTP